MAAVLLLLCIVLLLLRIVLLLCMLLLLLLLLHNVSCPAAVCWRCFFNMFVYMVLVVVPCDACVFLIVCYTWCCYMRHASGAFGDSCDRT